MFGLNAPIYSDGCGLRPFFDGLAETLVAETFYATWNGEGMVYPPERTITRLLDIGFSTIIAAGHSHGAHALRTALLGAPARSVDLAIFFDPAPVGQPFLWSEADRDPLKRLSPPPAAKRVICFYQRNDKPLCGVPFQPRDDGTVQNFMVGGPALTDVAKDCGDEFLDFGLHHSSMCSDPRVQDRMKLAILDVVNAHLHAGIRGAV
jgi:hypothetical protein